MEYKMIYQELVSKVFFLHLGVFNSY